MKKSVIALVILSVLCLVFIFYRKSKQTDGTAMHSCPPGYYYREGTSTWTGWEFNCLPIGEDSSLVAVPEDTNYSRAGTIYAPIIAGTRLESLPRAGPANQEKRRFSVGA
jgi:hypothetical protein